MNTGMTKKCFIAAPIGEASSPTRQRSDKVLRHIIKEPLARFGYEPVRADQIAEPGIITSQIIRHIVEDPLLIADLTDANPNVYYELAVRHAVKKPYIQIMQKGEKLPFDLLAVRTIQFDLGDPDAVDEARKQVDEQIKEVESNPGKLVESPVSIAVKLEDKGGRDGVVLSAIATTLIEVRASIEKLDKRLAPGGDVFQWHNVFDRVNYVVNRLTFFQSGLDNAFGRFSEEDRKRNEDVIQGIHHVLDELKHEIHRIILI